MKLRLGKPMALGRIAFTAHLWDQITPVLKRPTIDDLYWQLLSPIFDSVNTRLRDSLITRVKEELA